MKTIAITLFLFSSVFTCFAQSNLPLNPQELYYKIQENEIENFVELTTSPEILPEYNYLKKFEKNGIEEVIRHYDDKGVLRKIEQLKHGKRNGITKTFDKHGGLQQEVPYKDDNIHGVKKYYYESGALAVETVYINGKRKGNRTFYLKRYEKENEKISAVVPYENDQIDGIVKNYDKDGSNYFLRYEATFVKGKPHGIWVTYKVCRLPISDKKNERYTIRTTCKIEEENFVDGKKQGKQIRYWESGKIKNIFVVENGIIIRENIYASNGGILFTNEYVNGKEDGPVKRFHENDSIRFAVNYSKGKKQGKQFYYYDNGKIEKVTNYLNDTPIGESTEFYDNGNKKHEETLDEKGLKTGVEKFYFEDGKLREEGILSDSGRNRQTTYYDKYSGKKKAIEVYQNGVLVSYSYYDVNEKLFWTNTYRNGKRVGLFKNYVQYQLANQIFIDDEGNGYNFYYAENGKLWEAKYFLKHKQISEADFYAQFEIVNDKPIKK